ncbi:MAG: FixH family protein [Pseudohongiellaceae bacterium]
MNRPRYPAAVAALLLAITFLLTTPAWADTPELQATSRDGVQINLYSRLKPLQLNTMHSWEIELLDSSGTLITDAVLQVRGGMPEHDHGLPTSPQVTRTLTDGRYLLEGMRFHMPGLWVLTIELQAAGNTETVEITFEL